MSAYRDIPKNKFIFVKHNSQNVTKGSTILVNPRFKDNTKVFINPNFPTNAVNDYVISRPHIFVNPKIINSISSNSDIRNISSVNRNPLKNLPTDTSGRVLVSTKNKLIKVPEIKSNNLINSTTNFPKIINSSENHHKKDITTNSRVLISTKNKLIKVSQSKTNLKLPTFSNLHKNLVSTSHLYKKLNRFSYKLNTPEHCKLSRTKIMPSENKKLFQRHSTNTRFRYVKTGMMKKDNSVIRSQHKIINNTNTNKIVGQHVASNSTNFRKRFVYVNKYNSSSFLANNVILKNNKQRRFININGILYQNSPSALKKTNMPIRKHKDSQNLCTHNIQLKRSSVKMSPKCKRLSKLMIMEHEGRSKIVGSRVASSTLRKSNVPCPIFKKYGKCNGQKKGTCIKVHNSDQIILCSKFLRGACLKKNCLLSHKVSPEKMPTCKFYLEGLCARDDCQYIHVKISPKADICRDFLDGFCKEGTKCEKRHQLLCPEYEKYQKCPRRKCEYPHISKDTLVKKFQRNLLKVLKENLKLLRKM
ncbi:hypothetical protein WA026_021673 [Henosepilachna vigintioctopunctata]